MCERNECFVILDFVALCVDYGRRIHRLSVVCLWQSIPIAGYEDMWRQGEQLE